MKSLIESVRATLSKQALEEKYQSELSEQDVDHICESKYHVCAVVVEHPEWGEGKPLIGRHAEPDDEGNVAWYDVEFAHGIEEKVEAEGLNIIDEMSHGKKKKTEDAMQNVTSADKKPQNFRKPDGTMGVRMVPTDPRKKVTQEKMDPVGKEDDDIDNDGDVDKSDEYLKNRRKAIKKSMKKEDEPKGQESETATMNPKKEAKESTIRNKLMSIWEKAGDDRAKHIKGATKPDEQPTDRNASAKKMKDGHGEPKVDDTEEKGHKDAVAATRAGPSPKPRTNDSQIGDKKIVKGGTPMVGSKGIKSTMEAYESMYESYTHEVDYHEDGPHTAKKFVATAKKSGIKAKIHTMSGPGGGAPVVHLGHKDTKVIHKFLKKHYDSDIEHSDLDHHKIGEQTEQMGVKHVFRYVTKSGQGTHHHDSSDKSDAAKAIEKKTGQRVLGINHIGTGIPSRRENKEAMKNGN